MKVLHYNQWILKEHYDWIDNQVLITESFSLDKTKNFFKNLLHRVSGLSLENKKRVLKYGLISLLMTSPITSITTAMNSDINIKSQIERILDKSEMDKLLYKQKFKDVLNMKLSSHGLEHLKSEEGDPKNIGEPILKAYKIGDGKITIGWGHAESVNKSKFKIGQTISTEKAEHLLKKDISTAEDGVKRIFKEWKSEGVDIKITQEMFDVLVSMSFNMGSSGLRNSQAIQEIKNGNFQQAGESIKSIPHKKKFNGLSSRRERESKLFLTGITDLKNVKAYENLVASKEDRINYILSAQGIHKKYNKEELESMGENELKMVVQQTAVYNDGESHNDITPYTSVNNRKMNQHSYDSPNL